MKELGKWENESKELKREIKSLDNKLDWVLRSDLKDRRYIEMNDLRKKWNEIDDKFDKINDLYIEDLEKWIEEINFYLGFNSQKMKLDLVTWNGKVNIKARLLTDEEKQELIEDARKGGDSIKSRLWEPEE